MPVELLSQNPEIVASEVSSRQCPTSDSIEETIAWYRVNKVQVENLFALRAAIQIGWDESEAEEGIEITGTEILAKLRASK